MTRISSLLLRRRVVALVFCLSGCGDPPPSLDVEPVTGQVKRSDGSIVQQGIVELRSETQTTLTMSAIIHEGKFKLVTFNADGKYDGVPAGTYEVRIMAGDMSVQSNNAPPAPVRLKEPLTIADGQTEIELTLP